MEFGPSTQFVINDFIASLCCRLVTDISTVRQLTAMKRRYMNFTSSISITVYNVTIGCLF